MIIDYKCESCGEIVTWIASEEWVAEHGAAAPEICSVCLSTERDLAAARERFLDAMGEKA